MRTFACLAALLLAALLAVAARAAPPAADGWSRSVDGLRGRLLLTAAKDDRGRTQLAIGVELENTSDVAMPLSIFARPPSEMFELALEDEAGKSLARVHPGGNEKRISPYVLALPVRSTLRMELTPNAYEYIPTGKLWLRPFAFVAWDLTGTPAGKLYLKARVSPQPWTDSPPHAWAGSLELPRVALP